MKIFKRTVGVHNIRTFIRIIFDSTKLLRYDENGKLKNYIGEENWERDWR